MKKERTKTELENEIMQMTNHSLKPLIVKNVFDGKGNFVEQRILLPSDKDYKREYQTMLEKKWLVRDEIKDGQKQ